MASVKIIILALMLYSLSANDKIKLNELLSKQVPGRMRFVSNDGKISFYQKRNGGLAFSKNFKISEVLKGTPQINYSVIAGNEKKIFLLIKSTFYLTAHSIRNTPDLYTFKAEDKSIRYLGRGLSPRMHLLDTWASFYNPHQKQILIKSLVNSLLNSSIKINSTKNPFFIPEVAMIDNNRILYTDVNEKGHIALFLYTRSNKKSDVLYRPQDAGIKIELCTIKENLYLGKFPLNGIGRESQILEFNLKTPLDDSHGRIIYESSSSDYGNLICSSQIKKIFFIKVFPYGKSSYEYSSEVVELDPKTKQIQNLSQEKNITQIIEMDGRILIPHNGKLLIAKGDPLEDDSLD